MRLFGYCRVSTEQQAKKDSDGNYVGSLKVQRDLLLANGVEDKRIITDIASGKDFERTGIKTLLERMEEGDELLVCKLDRLGRDTLEMLEIIEEFEKRDIKVRFIQDGISTGGEVGKMVITILAAVATAERARILERTTEGRLEAKDRGVKFGRKPVKCIKQIQELKEQGMNNVQIAKKLGVSRQTVIKYLANR